MFLEKAVSCGSSAVQRRERKSRNNRKLSSRLLYPRQYLIRQKTNAELSYQEMTLHNQSHHFYNQFQVCKYPFQSKPAVFSNFHPPNRRQPLLCAPSSICAPSDILVFGKKLHPSQTQHRDLQLHFSLSLSLFFFSRVDSDTFCIFYALDYLLLRVAVLDPF